MPSRNMKNLFLADLQRAVCMVWSIVLRFIKSFLPYWVKLAKRRKRLLRVTVKKGIQFTFIKYFAAWHCVLFCLCEHILQRHILMVDVIGKNTNIDIKIKY
jgi:hypothetical protein